MEDEGWESEVEAEDHDNNEDAEQRVKSVSFPTDSQSCISANSPFRLSNFPRVPPYYRCSAKGRPPPKKRFYLGLCSKLWVGGGQKS